MPNTRHPSQSVLARNGFTQFCSLLTCTLIYGCAAQFSLPMSAAELVQHDSSAALAAYLSQPDASPEVCDRSARGPHLLTVDEKGYTALVRGLTDGRIAPDLWLRCAEALCRSGTCPADSALLIGIIGRGYRKLLTDSDFEKSPALQERLRAMQRLYTGHEPAAENPALQIDKMFPDLRRALAARRLGPTAAAFVSDLLTAFDLEHGKYFGRAVDLPMLDALFQASSEKALRRFAARLPQSALRDEARRRVIRLGIAASPFPEVKQRAAKIEDLVMKHGAYALTFAEHPPVRAFLAEQALHVQSVLVRQHVAGQKASLLAYSRQKSSAALLSEIRLQHWLMLEVQDISRPVTLCDPAAELDPTPCISPADVKLENPFVSIDKHGALQFAASLPMSAAVPLTSLHNRFLLPLSAFGQQLLTFDWPFFFERPEDLILTGSAPGESGPRLQVVVDRRDPAYYIFTVSGAGRPYQAVLESRDAAAFRIVSRGMPGVAGADGEDGSNGSTGAECQNGSNGSNGSDGGPGGPAGPGGDIAVHLMCGEAGCKDGAALLRQTLLSVGGPGGSGGRGGRGGSGGWGGSGRSATTHVDSDGNTVTDDSGCSSGMSGSSGSNGLDGEAGPPGSPGQVSFMQSR